jgi:hypothetical protein
MQTRIIIDHTDTATLKASPLWKEIMAVAFADEPVTVVEIASVDDAEQIVD